MTPKQTALRNVAKMLLLAIVVGASTSLLLIYVPWPYLAIGAVVITMLYLIHMIYELELDKAQILEDIKNQRETYEK